MSYEDIPEPRSMKTTRNYPWVIPVAVATMMGLLLLQARNHTERSTETEAVRVERPTPENAESIVLGMGCFWGAERRMSALPGVVDVVSGYAGGDYTDPTYGQVVLREYLPGTVNHAEVVKVVFDPEATSVENVLIGFWQSHNPTQGDRQGNDKGSQYRSAIYYLDDTQRESALRTRERYQKALTRAGHGTISTEIAPLKEFYPAEQNHQDYLVKNPNGYCGLGGIGVDYPDSTDSD